jgi:hypothetical protein
MASKPQQNRVWPKYVAKCAKCDLKESGVAYGGRGLCRKCYDYERKEGRLEEWSCHKPTMHQADNAALQACMMVGVTQVSRSIGVPKDKVVEWARTEVPKNKAARLRRYIAYIEQLIEEGMDVSEKRLNLFPFEKRELEDRMRDSAGEFSFPDW